MGRRRETGSGWRIRVNPWLIHVNVWQKPLQYCKVISVQLIIKINEINNKIKINNKINNKNKWKKFFCDFICMVFLKILFLPIQEHGISFYIFVYGVSLYSIFILWHVVFQLSQDNPLETLFSVLYSCLHCHGLIDHKLMGLFLGSLFYLSLCLFLCQSPVVLITVIL